MYSALWFESCAKASVAQQGACESCSDYAVAFCLITSSGNVQSGRDDKGGAPITDEITST